MIWRSARSFMSIARRKRIRLGVDPKRIVVVQVVVQARGEEVVGALHRVDVAGEMEVDGVGRHELRLAAARPSTFDAETGTDRGLSQRDDRAPADPGQRLPEPDADRGLAVTGRRGRDGGHHHELAVRCAAPRLEGTQVNLRDIATIENEVSLGEPQAAGDVCDGNRHSGRGSAGRVPGADRRIRRCFAHAAALRGHEMSRRCPTGAPVSRRLAHRPDVKRAFHRAV